MKNDFRLLLIVPSNNIGLQSTHPPACGCLLRSSQSEANAGGWTPQVSFTFINKTYALSSQRQDGYNNHSKIKSGITDW